MANPLLWAALITSLLALWVGSLAPRWSLRARTLVRLRHRNLAKNNADFTFWWTSLADCFTSRVLFKSDFKDMEAALETTGRNHQQSLAVYMIACWLMPAMSLVLGFTLLGSIGGTVMATAGFLLPRRVIRALGANAEKQQNLEAIELCHMTRMLMEAGLSIERALRLIAVQARPIMPHLAKKLDRFNRMMESGADRTAALEELDRSRRIFVLRNYISLMKQSGTLGAGVSLGLDQIIHEARQAERSRLKEITNRTGAKMTVVMLMFMLPALFILIGGPAVLSIAAVLGR